MVAAAVSRFDARYLELVRLIDRGEHGIAVAGEHCNGFGGSVCRVVFEDGRNYGVMSAFLYCGSLRIHLVFRDAVTGGVPALILRRALAAIINDSDPRSSPVLWEQQWRRAQVLPEKGVEDGRQARPVDDGHGRADTS